MASILPTPTSSFWCKLINTAGASRFSWIIMVSTTDPCVQSPDIQNAVSHKMASTVFTPLLNNICINEGSSDIGGRARGVKEEAVGCHSWGSRRCPCSSGWCDFMMNRWEEVSGPWVLSVTSTLRTSGGDLWEWWRSSLQPLVFLWQRCGIFTHRDRMSGILGKHFGCDWNY